MATIKQYFNVNFSLILISVQLITSIKAQWAIDDDGCTTPLRGIGSCVPIHECKPMIDFLRNSTLLTPKSKEVLRSYQCGFINNSVKVCCPNHPLTESGEPTPSLKPPDVSNHTNLKLLPSKCGSDFLSSRIIGGSETYLFEYPWMALLSYKTESGLDFRCGGTIINERYILTAAQCLTNLSGLKLKGVRVGEYNISSGIDCQKEAGKDEFCAPPVQEFGISKVILHPLYNSSTFEANIGLIRLDSPIDLSAGNAKTICLPVTPRLQETQSTDTKLRVTGWGSTETGRRHDVLQKVDLPVVTEGSCRNAYANLPVVINDKQICAGGRHRTDFCYGDSGGPLKSLVFHNDDVRYVQYGVVSFGPSLCGKLGVPGVFTRIVSYMDWILDNIKP